MKIRDRSTGEIIEINDNEAGNYGLTSAPTQTTPSGNLNITPQQAMMAKLLLPSSQSSMVEGAYNIQRQNQQDIEKQQEKERKRIEESNALKGFAEVAQELKQGTKDINVLNAPFMKVSGMLGNETPLKQFDRKKAVVTQFLAKLGEGNRITDKDREFYTQQILNIGPYGGQAGKEESLDQIIRDVVRLAGEDPDLILNQNQKKNTNAVGQDNYQALESSTADTSSKSNAISFDNPVLQFFNQVGENAQNNLIRNVEDMKQLPAQVAGYTMPGMLYNQAIGNTDYMKPKNLAQTVGNVVKGEIQRYVDIATNPGSALYNNPIDTLAALMPLTQLGKGGVASGAGVADDVASLGAGVADDVASLGAGVADDIASLADDVKPAPNTGINSILDDLPNKDISKLAEPKVDPAINRIIEKAAKAGNNEGVPQVARHVYQSVLNFSKKNNAFERLKPNQTVATMIEDGIYGTPNTITKKLQTVTGKNGILSSVVDEAIVDASNVVTANLDDMGGINKFLTEKMDTGGYAYITENDFNVLRRQLNNQPQIPGKAPGTYDLSKLLELERKLQEQGTTNKINGIKGDVRSTELGNLQLDVASEIGDVIDSKVSKVKAIEKYKDPDIVNALNEVSPRLAEKYSKAETISDIRSLQRDYVRMSKIMELAMQEPSSLGRNFFRGAAQLPIVGPIGDAIAQYMAVPAATKTAGYINSLSKNPVLNNIFK